MEIARADFVAVPSTDWERSRAFYVDTLGLRPDEHAQGEFWAGDQCFGIWEPATFGMEFAPQRNGHIAFHVDDVAGGAQQSSRRRASSSPGRRSTRGVCHMAFFRDPDGNDLMLHHRYAPRSEGRTDS